MNKIYESQMFVYHTCDSIDPITNQESNKHDEHLVIIRIYQNDDCLYRNLDDGFEGKISKAWFSLGLKTGYLEEM